MAEPREFKQTRFAPPPGSTEILLVRHGASQAFVEGETFELADGHGDPPLAPEGREQAEQVGNRLAGEHIDAIYVTSLRRTVETAAPLVARTGIQPIVEKDLREVFLGEWEGGLLRAKFADGDPIAARVIEEQRWDAIPGAESNEVFAGRLRASIERIHAAHADQRVVAVVHGGVIAELLHQATDSRPWAFVGADNGSISHLLVVGDRWSVRRYNDTAHLDGGFSTEAEDLT
jgi:probable phosphoglycerate mutase